MPFPAFDRSLPEPQAEVEQRSEHSGQVGEADLRVGAVGSSLIDLRDRYLRDPVTQLSDFVMDVVLELVSLTEPALRPPDAVVAKDGSAVSTKAIRTVREVVPDHQGEHQTERSHRQVAVTRESLALAARKEPRTLNIVGLTPKDWRKQVADLRRIVLAVPGHDHEDVVVALQRVLICRANGASDVLMIRLRDHGAIAIAAKDRRRLVGGAVIDNDDLLYRSSVENRLEAVEQASDMRLLVVDGQKG